LKGAHGPTRPVDPLGGFEGAIDPVCQDDPKSVEAAERAVFRERAREGTKIELNGRAASFETVASRPPQDEECFVTPSKDPLMLRSRRRRRLQARATRNPSVRDEGCDKGDRKIRD